jgi:hypothetical protein
MRWPVIGRGDLTGNIASSIASSNLEFCWRKGGITIEMERGCSRKPSGAPATPGANGKGKANARLSQQERLGADAGGEEGK